MDQSQPQTIVFHQQYQDRAQLLKIRLDSKSVDLGLSDFKNNGNFLTWIHSWSVEDLSACDSRRSTIVKQISNINFIRLQYLSLRSSEIDSIEGIVRIGMGDLTALYLCYNPINSLRSLRKCRLPRLKNLSFNETKVIDAQCLSALKAQLAWLCFDFETYEQSNPEDLRLIGKLESIDLTSLCLVSKKRIRQETAKNRLKTKFQKLRYDEENFLERYDQ